jgi:tetratricopeptide (TPR) repeat protein
MIYKSLQKGKDILFGFGFFMISIVLVLQILPVGGAIIADRYTYIPYVGIFFIIARFINNLIENKIMKLQLYKIPLIITFAIISILYAYVAFQRTKVWENTITLFTDAIKNNNKASRSFMVRGNAYYYKGQYENAISDLSKAILLKNDYAEAYLSRGSAYFNLGKINEAIKNFSLAIMYKPNYADAYCDRAIAYLSNKTYDLALQDALKAKGLGFQIHPNLIEDIETRMNNKKK